MNLQETPVDLTGQTLCDYQILRRLGRGGMADVYLAKQFSLQRNVALKILKPELAKDESYVKRFHHEAQSAAALVQANIVQIYEVGQCDGLHYIAQEYVNGRNLRQYLDRHGAIEGVMALNLILQCSRALQKASEFGVVHRDIKPENILLSTTGEVKVADFGLARVNGDASRQSLTQVGITMGTPLYMSPEQVEGKPLDSRSDIYSLGVTLYHTLSGRPPFEGDNALAIAFKQVKEEPAPIQQTRPDLPIELCQLIARMMAKDPGDRPQHPTELLKEVKSIKVEIPDDFDSIADKLAIGDYQTDGNNLSSLNSKLSATQHLQAVLRGNDRRRWYGLTSIILLVGLSVLGAWLGYFLANRSIPSFPLSEIELTEGRVARRPTIEQQYFAAYVGSGGGATVERKIDLWNSVIDYFPVESAERKNTTLLYHRRAKVRLGEIYLTEGDLQKAFEIYDALEKEGASEELYRQYQVFGYAGKLVVYFRSVEIAGGELEQQEKIGRYLGLIGDETDLLNQFMREEVKRIREIYIDPLYQGAAP